MSFSLYARGKHHYGIEDIFHFLFPLEASTSASRFYSIASGNTISYQASYGFWDPPTQAR